MSIRKLASIQRILALDPIHEADRIEVATIKGWKVVVNKGLHEVGDLVVYFEIDSWVPTELAPFLTKDGHEPKEFEGVRGERLRTVKLRGQISAGLLLPLAVLGQVTEKEGKCFIELPDSYSESWRIHEENLYDTKQSKQQDVCGSDEQNPRGTIHSAPSTGGESDQSLLV